MNGPSGVAVRVDHSFLNDHQSTRIVVAIAGVVFGIGAACGLAGQAFCIRLGTRTGRSNDALLVVILVNVAVFLPLAILFVPSPTLSVRAIIAFVAAGIVGTMLGRAFFYAGIKRVGASRAEPIKASMPLHATVLAVLFLGEHVSGLQGVGIVLIAIGIAAISWEGGAADRRAGRAVPWIGLLMPLLAAFFFGLEPIFATVGLVAGTEVLVGLAIKSVTALIVVVGYLTVRGTVPRPTEIPRSDLRWYVLAGISSTGFLLMYYAGLSVSRVGIVVPIMQTSPLLVILGSAVFLRRIETVTPKLVTAAAIIVGGSVIVTVFG